MFTDSNVYLYLAGQVLSGKILYKELYMTNFPLVAYVSAFYKIIFFGSIQWYYLTAAIEAILSAVVLILIIKKLFKNEVVGFVSGYFYLSSFIVFSTAGHQTGVTTAVLLFNIGYLAFIYKKYLITGLLLGLAISAKAYILPLVIALIIYSLISERKAVPSILVGVISSIVITMLPTLILARNEFYSQTFAFSLSRTAGFNKLSVIFSFIRYDPIIFMLIILSLIRIKKLIFPGIASILCILFFLFHKDIYLMYFIIFVPIAVIAFADLFQIIKKRSRNLVPVIIFLTIIFIIQAVNIYYYWSNIKNFMTIPNVKLFIQKIHETNPDYLYGEYSMVQGLSYLSKVPMIDGVSDTNRKLYVSGILDKRQITKQVNKTRTLLVSYSYNDNLNIASASGPVDWDELKGKCKIIHSQDFRTSSLINKINLVKCY